MSTQFTRRRLLLGAGATALAAAWPAAAAEPPITRPIGARAEPVPAIGMGTWLTFDVGDDPEALAVRTRVLRAFFEHGGSLIDSSPMYGRAERVLGACLARLEAPPVFAATKVWKYGREAGRRAMAESQSLWRLPRIDLMQIHNLLDWQAHMDTLIALRERGDVRYLGITTSHGRRHREFADVMAARPELDAVQFTYNVTHREAEQRLLPMAAERGLAVLVNRPLDGGRLFDQVKGRPLPDFAAEIGCTNWSQLFLKFVIAHPAVTCAIPATRRVDHMLENVGAMRGPLPDADLRRRIVAAVTDPR